MKVLSFGVAQNRKGEPPLHSFHPFPKRDQLLWLNHVPPPHVHWSKDDTSTDMALAISPLSYLRDSEPWQYVDFGGPRGEHLQYLTCITAYQLPSCNAIVGLDFTYLKPITTEGEGLGSIRKVVKAWGCERADSGAAIVVKFNIDGPCGERITEIEVCATRNRYLENGPNQRVILKVRLLLPLEKAPTVREEKNQLTL